MRLKFGAILIGLAGLCCPYTYAGEEEGSFYEVHLTPQPVRAKTEGTNQSRFEFNSLLMTNLALERNKKSLDSIDAFTKQLMAMDILDIYFIEKFADCLRSLDRVKQDRKPQQRINIAKALATIILKYTSNEKILEVDFFRPDQVTEKKESELYVFNQLDWKLVCMGREEADFSDIKWD